MEEELVSDPGDPEEVRQVAGHEVEQLLSRYRVRVEDLRVLGQRRV